MRVVTMNNYFNIIKRYFKRAGSAMALLFYCSVNGRYLAHRLLPYRHWYVQSHGREAFMAPLQKDLLLL
jgi:hypothetical protein